MKLHVHIECLVLDGLPVDRRSAARVQEAVESELSRLLLESSSSSRIPVGGALESLRTAPVSVSPQNKSHHIGAAIAQSLHGGIQG